MDTTFQILKPASGARPPAHYSHTSLTQIETCPRRWWLLHSQFEELRGRYPEPISAAGMLGSIVHGTLEQFSIEFARAIPREEGSSIKDFRKQFPVREIVRARRKRFLEEANANPRAQIAALESNVSVDSCISLFKELIRRSYGEPAFECLVAAQNSRREAKGAPPTAQPVGHGGASERKKITCPSVSPEVDLKLEDPRIRGKIDLVATALEGDTLVEYKTGQPQPEHEKQSRLYAFLWWAVTGRLVRERQLLYPNHDIVKLGEVTRDEVEQEGKLVRERIAWAEKEIQSTLPSVHLDAERCGTCTVRQLCPEYWSARETATARWMLVEVGTARARTDAVEWRDIQIELDQTEPLSEGFIVRAREKEGVKRIVCKVPHQFRPASMSSYTKVRLLNVRVVADGDGLRIVWSSFSEAFWGRDSTC
jgi:CRISPR/Cas system-associated exonuclease Cas4 (RecB family)